MNYKKITLTTVAALSLLSLGACGKSTSTDTDIVTMKGNTIKVTDFYNASKNNTSSTATQVLQQLILDDVLEAKYSGKVTKKDVEEEFEKTKKQYGDQFATALQQTGLTEESYKESIKTRLLIQYAVDEAVKKEYTDENMKKAWESFHPEVTARIIEVSDEKVAKETLDEVNKDTSKFGDIAKEKSVADSKDKGGEVKFDSNSEDIPSEVKTAAFKLEDGKVSDVITVTNESTGMASYYIVKMEKNSKKGNDMKKYEKDLKKAIKNEKEADTNFTNGVIGSILKEYNVTIKEKEFSDVLAAYIGSTESEESK